MAKEIPTPTPGQNILWESTEGGVHRVTKRFNPSVQMLNDGDVQGWLGRYGQSDQGLIGGALLALGGEGTGRFAGPILEAKGIPNPSRQQLTDLCIALDPGATGHIPDEQDFIDIVGHPDPDAHAAPEPPVAVPDGRLIPTPLMTGDFQQAIAGLESRLMAAIKGAAAAPGGGDKAKLALQHLSLRAAEIQALATPKHQRFDDLVAAISAAVAEGGA